MAAETLLKDLYAKILGGTNPTETASSTGDIAAMIKYLAATANATWGSLFGTPSQATTEFGLTIPYMLAVPHGGTNLRIGVAAGVSASMSVQWDATNKQWYWQNTTGVFGYMRFALPTDAVQPMGPYAGAMPAFANPNLHVYPPNTAAKKFVMEWYGNLGAAARAGFGTPTTGISVSNVARHITAWVNGAKWQLDSGDGTTGSNLAETTSTGDTNLHLFRLEWRYNAGTLTADFYVDGVLKITKTTNIPDPQTTGQAYQIYPINADAGAATAETLAYGVLCYWKD